MHILLKDLEHYDSTQMDRRTNIQKETNYIAYNDCDGKVINRGCMKLRLMNYTYSPYCSR